MQRSKAESRERSGAKTMVHSGRIAQVSTLSRRHDDQGLDCRKFPIPFVVIVLLAWRSGDATLRKPYRGGVQGRGMGLRFRRASKLLSGVRLKVSGSGIATSIGHGDAHTTLSGKWKRIDSLDRRDWPFLYDSPVAQRLSARAATQSAARIDVSETAAAGARFFQQAALRHHGCWPPAPAPMTAATGRPGEEDARCSQVATRFFIGPGASRRCAAP